MSVRVEEVPAEATYQLRGAVLRPDGGEIIWAGDDDDETFHLAARGGDGQVVGVVRFSPAPCPWRPLARTPWQLRGMATEPEVRGSGAGRAMVVEGMRRVADRGGDVVWCDARTGAIGFYERMGFAVVTGEYDKPGIGPHVGMVADVVSGSAPAAAADGNRSS